MDFGIIITLSGLLALQIGGVNEAKTQIIPSFLHSGRNNRKQSVIRIFISIPPGPELNPQG